MQTFQQDLKHALRMFRENPGFTATAIAALALGIGVNTAIFSVVNAVLLKPVPFPEPDSLVQPVSTLEGALFGPNTSPAKFMHWRAQSDVFKDVAGYDNTSLNYTKGDIPEVLTATQVSEAYFRVFGAPIVEGRSFTPDEDLPGAPRTVVLSHNFWTQRLGGDPDIVGKGISLSGDTYTVIGVVGRNFDLREFGDPELWVPLQLDPNATDQAHFFRAAARLRPGVTVDEAHARLVAAAAPYRERFPAALRDGESFAVLSMQQALVGPEVRNTLWVLLGAVSFVLLIACANVANLLLIRATGRRREIAIRAALGAGRGRIVRQLLAESVLLAAAGGALGLVAGFLGMRGLLTVNTAGLPRLGDAGSLMGMDWRIVTFTVALSLVTGVLFGLVPALVGSRADLNAVIKDASSRSGSGFQQNRTRSVLVTLEIGLGVVLLIGAALLIRTSLALAQVDPGFNAANVLTLKTSLSGPRFATTDSVDATVRDALDRVRALPGIVAAAATCCVPLQGSPDLPFNIVGRANEQGPFTGGSDFVIGGSGYFETFQIPVLRGRGIDDGDNGAAPPVAVINQAFANRYWSGGADPLEDRILIGGGRMEAFADEPVRQIVGIVGDVRSNSLGQDPVPTMYVPHAQMPDAFNAFFVNTTPMVWVARTRAEPASVSGAIQELLREATGLPVTAVQSMEEVMAISTSRARLNMLLMSIFGGVALLLAAIGIYGLMAHSVQQRTQELGIRVALGAEPRQVHNMVVRQGMLLTAIGVAAGLVAAFYLADVLANILFGVQPRDAGVFVTVPVVLTLIALAAVTIAARQASRVDPLEALRYE